MNFNEIIYFDIINTVNNGVNENIFMNFLSNLIIRIPFESILILDNAAIHCTKRIFWLLQSTNTFYLYLSPYSPDYQPIELLFNYLKIYLKKYYKRRISVPDAIRAALESVTPQLLQSFIQKVLPNWVSNDI
jgi:transposase